MNPLYWIHELLSSSSAAGRFAGILVVIFLGLLPLLGFALAWRWRKERLRKARRRRGSRQRTHEVTQEDVEASRW
jgi:hypothetical protein